jgi:acyl-CoA hydrolase
MEKQHKTLSMTLLMTPDMANFSGHIHGGATLRLLDQAAYACASRYSNHYVVTMSVDQVFFREPIYVGELVTFLASVNFTGTTSMEVGIRVLAEDIIHKTTRHAMTCYFTMVAVDEQGRSVQVPPLRIENPLECRRNEGARLRREFRREIEARNRAIREASVRPTPDSPCKIEGEQAPDAKA